MSHPFHVVLYHWEETLPEPEESKVGETLLKTIPINRDVKLGPSRFPTTFEEAMAGMERVFNAYTEGDGAFGFASDTAEESWRVSGTIFETEGQLGCVDVFLTDFPQHRFLELLTIIGTDPAQVVVHLPDSGWHMRGEAFLQYLENTN